MLILIAARQAILAAIPRRRSARETLLCLTLGHFENFKHQLFDLSRSHARRRAFHRDGAVAERLRIETGTLQFVGDARIFDLLRGG